MKDKQIIEKIQLLRMVKPDEETLRLIHNKTKSQISDGVRYPQRNLISLLPLVSLGAFALIIIFLSIATGFLTDSIHQSIVNTEIALAPNHYIKAKIAVADAESKFANLKKKPAGTNKLSSFSHSLALANRQMAQLQLKGEKGKYTMQDCLALYTTYYNSLESMKQATNSQTNFSNVDKELLEQINQYDKQAEKKLYLYKQ